MRTCATDTLESVLMLTLTLILIYMGEDLTAFRLPKVAVFLTTPFSSKLGGYAELADRYRRVLCLSYEVLTHISPATVH